MPLRDGKLPHSSSGEALQVLKPGTSQDVNFDGSVQSNTLSSTTRIVRLCPTMDCRVAFGTDPTATATSMFIPGLSEVYVEVVGGTKIAAIKESTAGKLNIVEME